MCHKVKMGVGLSHRVVHSHAYILATDLIRYKWLRGHEAVTHRVHPQLLQQMLDENQDKRCIWILREVWPPTY